jgi:type IV pilus assembly protein PilW
LIELMVGLVLGLLTILIVAQIAAFAEGQKRTTTSGSEAQTNGAVALFALQRDIEAAGYGLAVVPDVLGCTVNGQGSAGTPLQFPLVPVLIDFGSAGAPDQINVLTSAKAGFSLPIRITENHAQAADTFVVQSTLGINAGDVMIAAPASWSTTNTCTLFNATTAAGKSLTVTSLPHETSDSGSWNHAALLPAAGYSAGSLVLNLGSVSRHTYAVNAAGTLQQISIDPTGAAVTQDLYPQVVTIRALYGKDTNGDGTIDAFDAVTPTTAAGWRQVVAIRIAVVARSAQFEKTVVTDSEPLWDVGSAIAVNDRFGAAADCHAGSKCLTLGISGLTDWQRYRYKVYDTVVPLRNVLWNS